MNIPKANDSNNGKNCTTLNNFIPALLLYSILFTDDDIYISKKER